MNGVGRGPYRTLGSVVDACGRQNPFVQRAVDAATQYMEDELEKRLDEYLLAGLNELPINVMRTMLKDSRDLLYRYLKREVPRAVDD